MRYHNEAVNVRELVIVLNRQSCLDQLSKCAVTDHDDGPNTCTAKCIPPLGLAKGAKFEKLEKVPWQDHGDSVIRSDPAVPRTSRDSQCVDVDGVKSKLVQVTRDPKLDRLALKYGTSENSDEGFVRRRNSKNGRRGSKASGRSGREDAILIENMNKDVFLSQLSLYPYCVSLRTRKSFQKLLETSTQHSESLGRWKQIQAERNICQNLNSKRQLHVSIERNDVIDRLALQRVCLNNFEISKTNNCRMPLKPVRKVLLKSTAGQEQVAAESASVPPTTQCDRVELVSSGTTDQTPCLKNLSVYNIEVPCTDQVSIRTSDTVVSPRELQEIDVNSNVIMDQNISRVQSGGQQDKLISIEPPAKCLLSLNTRKNTSARILPEISGQEKGVASPVPITVAARAITSEERRRNDTGLSSNSGAPHDLNSTQAEINPTVNIIKLKRVTGDNWALIPDCPNAPVSSITAGTEARSRTVFVKLHRDSNIDRLALEDCKYTAFQPPSHNEWPKVTVDAEVHHSENESPRKTSIPPSRTIRKRFPVVRNFRKDKLIRKKFVSQKNSLNFPEASNNSVSRYMAVKKPLRVRSDFDSISIDSPYIGS